MKLNGEAEQNFWSKVNKTEECWVWIDGNKSHNGYGLFRINGRQFRAHRLSYETYCGPIPKGMYVCHSCDNPPCVRPDHLWLGTPKDNQSDAKRKGRKYRPRGERNSQSILTAAQVREILGRTSESDTELAKQYGVAPSTISDIRRGRAWSHIKPRGEQSRRE